jgi:membrane-associated phospholipid phosphatase
MMQEEGCKAAGNPCNRNTVSNHIFDYRYFKQSIKKSESGDLVKLLKKNKHIWMIPIYGIFYILFFIYLEQRDVKYHIVHFALDDFIPFCEYFIIPYVLWYGFVAVTIWYFAFRCRKREEYWQLAGALMTGMTVFLITSFVYPNGHNLRPSLQDGNLFVQAVKLLYWIDPPTNIFPSIHVFNTVACCRAVCQNQECAKHRTLIFGTKLLSALIILSTMFIKQHSVMDVLLALLLYALCYQLFYKTIPQYRKRIADSSTGINGRKEINYYAE